MPVSTRLAATGIVATLALAVATPGQAQDYPSRPIRVIVPYSAGGGADNAARVIAQRLGTALHTQVVIDNRPGASGIIGAQAVVQAAPDGKKVIRKMLGTHIKPPDLSLTRVAPTDMGKDAMWGWFNEIYNKGMPVGNRGSERKDGSIVIYDSTGAEVARFNFYNGWPSKIATDQLSVDSNDPVKETITLTIERLERTK